MGKSKGVIYVLLGAASFGFTPIFAKMGFKYDYTLGQINVVQVIISFLLLWGIFLIKRPSTKGLTLKSSLKLMLVGTFIGLTSIFYYGSINYLPASLAIILLFQFVWIGLIYEWVFNKVKPTINTLISMVITLTGVFFASNIMNGEFNELPLIGLIFGILAGFTYAGFIFFSGKVSIEIDPWLRSPLMVTGSTILVLFVFMSDIQNIQPNEGRLWIVGTGVALFGAVLPPLLFALGSPKISGGLANILSSIELPVAITSAYFILSEPVTLLQWVGIFIIMFAILINEYGNQVKRLTKVLY